MVGIAGFWLIARDIQTFYGVVGNDYRHRDKKKGLGGEGGFSILFTDAEGLKEFVEDSLVVDFSEDFSEVVEGFPDVGSHEFGGFGLGHFLAGLLEEGTGLLEGLGVSGVD